MTWILTLHRLPDSMNVRERKSHWTRRRELQEITDELGVLAIAAKIPAAQSKRWVRITLHKSLRSRKRDDPANRDSRAKSILDALVKLGILIDDDDTHLQWLGVVEGERCEQIKTVVEIGDVA